MSEPREIARGLERVVDGVYHWRIRNSAIGGAISSSHAVVGRDATVFVDPVGLEPKVLHTLPRPTAILLTATCHQRAAWRLRAELGADVWLPAGAPPADDEPDHLYDDGAALPGGLVALHTPGPEQAHYAFLLEEHGGILFCPDLVANAGTDELHLVPPEYQEDPRLTRKSLTLLVTLPFETLCLAHGTPVKEHAKDRILAALGEAPVHAHV
ncbi:MAG TPA: MBL fold metallo-hydrolase [Gaiellaceae bacterium]